MLKVFVLLIVVGGVVRLTLEWQLKKHWRIALGVPLSLFCAPRHHHWSTPARPSGTEELRCGSWK